MYWTVKNFKGLDSGSVRLSPGTVSVIAGANSSGKSSLLQSILLFTQSLRDGTKIVRNGPLTRLGQASDIIRADASHIEYQMDFERVLPAGWEDIFEEDLIEEQNLRVRLELRPDQSGDDLLVQQIEIGSPDSDSTPLVLSIHGRRRSDLEIISRDGDTKGTTLLHLKQGYGSETRTLRTYVAFEGLTPTAVYQVVDPEKIHSEYSRRLSEVLSSPRGRGAVRGLNTNAFGSPFFVRHEAFRLFRDSPDYDASSYQASERVGLVSRMSREFFAELASSAPEDQAATIDELALQRSTYPWKKVLLSGKRVGGYYVPSIRGLLEEPLFEKMKETFLVLAEYAQGIESSVGRVQYLGPLRDEPRVVSNQWSETSLGLPVGARGEYSAAVLRQSGATEVEYCAPDGKMKHGALNEAVNQWSSYIGIGSIVGTVDRGKLGVGLELQDGKYKRDLTSVGVGVSQAVPLVVALLSIPARSTFIVEQPELHLHPSLQARLADFLSAARPDCSLIIETHSDHLVTRLRRRIAERNLSAEKVRIVFVDDQRDSSRTRELSVTRFGDLSEWPAGFMSDTEDDVEAILRANIASSLPDRSQE